MNIISAQAGRQSWYCVRRKRWLLLIIRDKVSTQNWTQLTEENQRTSFSGQPCMEICIFLRWLKKRIKMTWLKPSHSRNFPTGKKNLNLVPTFLDVHPAGATWRPTVLFCPKLRCSTQSFSTRCTLTGTTCPQPGVWSHPYYYLYICYS